MAATRAMAADALLQHGHEPYRTELVEGIRTYRHVLRDARAVDAATLRALPARPGPRLSRGAR